MALLKRPGNKLLFCIVCLTLLLVSVGPHPSAQEESGRIDEAGREAFALWQEKETERAVAEATRRYWDYWSSQPPSRYGSRRLWLKLDQVQRWLKDPENNPPPPPPPPSWRMYQYPPYPPPPWVPLWIPPPYDFYVAPFARPPAHGDYEK